MGRSHKSNQRENLHNKLHKLNETRFIHTKSGEHISCFIAYTKNVRDRTSYMSSKVKNTIFNKNIESPRIRGIILELGNNIDGVWFDMKGSEGCPPGCICNEKTLLYGQNLC